VENVSPPDPTWREKYQSDEAESSEQEEKETEKKTCLHANPDL